MKIRGRRHNLYAIAVCLLDAAQVSAKTAEGKDPEHVTKTASAFFEVDDKTEEDISDELAIKGQRTYLLAHDLVRQIDDQIGVCAGCEQRTSLCTSPYDPDAEVERSTHVLCELMSPTDSCIEHFYDNMDAMQDNSVHEIELFIPEGTEVEMGMLSVVLDRMRRAIKELSASPAYGLMLILDPEDEQVLNNGRNLIALVMGQNLYRAALCNNNPPDPCQSCELFPVCKLLKDEEATAKNYDAGEIIESFSLIYQSGAQIATMKELSDTEDLILNLAFDDDSFNDGIS